MGPPAGSSPTFLQSAARSRRPLTLARKAFSGQRPARFIGGFAAWLLFATAGPVPRIFDAAEYWALSTSWVDGIPHTELLRGYASGFVFVPAVLASRLTRLSPELAILGEMSLILALLGWEVLPSVAATALGTSVVVGHRVFSTVLLWFLWGGFASAALMDVPALLLFLAALLVSWRKGVWLLAVFAGLLVGLAGNIRPAYVLAAAGLVIVVAITDIPGWRSRLTRSTLVVLGLAIALVPQSAMNVAAGAPAYPPTPVGTSDFLAYHLSYGLIYQRYETAVDPNWPSPEIWSCDPGGIALVQASRQPAPTTLTSYARLLAGSPVAGAGLLARRMLSLLWLSERSPYVRDVFNRTVIFGFVNVVLVGLLIAIAFGRNNASSRFSAALILLLLACAPGLISLPDPRFFLPLSAGAIAFALPALSWVAHAGWRIRLPVAVVCLALVLASLAVVSQATALQLPGSFPRAATPPCPAVPFVH